MENENIPDANIQASAIHSSAFPAHNGRLNALPYGWLAPLSANQPWIQADLGYQTYVSGVATQGDPIHGWVTSFKVSTFKMTTANDEIYVSETGGVAKVNEEVLLTDHNLL